MLQPHQQKSHNSPDMRAAASHIWTLAGGRLKENEKKMDSSPFMFLLLQHTIGSVISFIGQ